MAVLKGKAADFEDLCGVHELSGVDFESRDVPEEFGGGTEHAQVCRFRIDGRVYVAIEDPSDGYRSSMRGLFVGREKMTNAWAPLKVLGSVTKVGRYGSDDDVLEFRALATGEIVLRVGTENTSDYYPSFISDFRPEALTRAGKDPSRG